MTLVTKRSEAKGDDGLQEKIFGKRAMTLKKRSATLKKQKEDA